MFMDSRRPSPNVWHGSTRSAPPPRERGHARQSDSSPAKDGRHDVSSPQRLSISRLTSSVAEALVRPPLQGCYQLDFSARAGLVGMKNLGNTCFMNTGLQCLSHIEPFAAYFLTGKYKEDLNQTNPRGHSGQLAVAFAKLQEVIWLRELTVLEPAGFHKKLTTFCPRLFEDGEQQDVYEFITFCLDGLHQDLNRNPAWSPDEVDAAAARLNPDADEETSAALAWMGNLKGDCSFIVDLLQGQIRSSLQCSRCGHDWRRFDPFLYLSLPVTADMRKVTDALLKFQQDETLTNSGDQLCPHCNSKVAARKKMSIWKLPPVLVLHLKRFAWDMDAGQFQKLTNTLAVPLEVELSKYCASNQRHGATYELCCVANHHGNYGHGHYAAACRVSGFETGHEWFFFDDIRTTQITSEQAATMASKYGYVLFFMRTSERNALSGPKRQTVTMPEAWPHMVPSLKRRVLETRREEEEADVNLSARGSRSSGTQEKSPDRQKLTAADKELEARLAKLTVGDQVMCVGLKPPVVGTIRFVGAASFSAGEWIGIELNEDVGKNDGSVLGVQYFKCRPQAGLFVRRSPNALRVVGTTPRRRPSSAATSAQTGGHTPKERSGSVEDSNPHHKSVTLTVPPSNAGWPKTTMIAGKPEAADRHLIGQETEVGKMISPRGFIGSQEDLKGSASIRVSSKAEMRDALNSCASEVDRLQSAVTSLGEAIGTGTPAWAAAGLQPKHKALLEKLLSEAGARLGKRLEERIRQPLQQQVKSAIARPLGKLRGVAEEVQKLCPQQNVHA